MIHHVKNSLTYAKLLRVGALLSFTSISKEEKALQRTWLYVGGRSSPRNQPSV